MCEYALPIVVKQGIGRGLGTPNLYLNRRRQFDEDDNILPWHRLVGVSVTCKYAGSRWYVDDSPYLAEGR